LGGLRGYSDFDVELILHAVFTIMDEHVMFGKILDIKKTLPTEIREH
jgi:uncharacterized protein (DUF2267 family)